MIVSVVYHFTGQQVSSSNPESLADLPRYIASPALGSAGPLLKRVSFYILAEVQLTRQICYGIAIPGLLVGGMVNLHLPAKYGQYPSPQTLTRMQYAAAQSLNSKVFVRLLGGTRHLSRNTPIHLLVWLYVTPPPLLFF